MSRPRQPCGLGAQAGREAGGGLAGCYVAGIPELAALPTADQSQFDLVPIAFDQGAIQMPIAIARHDAIGLHHEGLALGHWRILAWRLLRTLYLRHGGPLFAFEFDTDRFCVGAQRFDAHLHSSQRCQLLSRLSKRGQAAQHGLPVLDTTTGALFGS